MFAYNLTLTQQPCAPLIMETPKKKRVSQVQGYIDYIAQVIVSDIQHAPDLVSASAFRASDWFRFIQLFTREKLTAPDAKPIKINPDDPLGDMVLQIEVMQAQIQHMLKMQSAFTTTIADTPAEIDLADLRSAIAILPLPAHISAYISGLTESGIRLSYLNTLAFVALSLPKVSLTRRKEIRTDLRIAAETYGAYAAILKIWSPDPDRGQLQMNACSTISILKHKHKDPECSKGTTFESMADLRAYMDEKVSAPAGC